MDTMLTVGPDLAQTLSLHQGEAERMFAGAVMIDEEYARERCSWLEPGCFRDDKIAAYWAAVRDGKAAAEAAVEGGIYLDVIGYMGRVVSLYHVTAYADAISQDRYLRESTQYLGDMARAIANRDVESLKTLSGLIANASPYTGDTVPSAYDVHREFLEMLDRLDGQVELSGITSLDNATGGFEKQTLTVIGARPSMGKSSLAAQIAQNNAERKRRVVLFSLEMSAAQLWARMACGRLEIAWRDVLTRHVTTQQIEQIKQQSKALADHYGEYLMIDDKATATNEDLYRKIANLEPDLVIVDHLDLVNRQERGKVNEVIRLGNNSRQGKVIAKQFDIPVIYLMQLNRATEMRDIKRPQLSDIRFSGDIEQDADNVWFLYRPDYYDDPTSDSAKEPPRVSLTEVVVAKFRNGVRNIQINLEYHLAQQWFYPQKRTQGQR